MSVIPSQILEGGLGAVKGLQLTGISAGFRRNPERKDLAVIVAPSGARAAGVFTQSGFAAPPVLLSRMHLAAQAAQDRSGEAAGFRALIINSGNANAATGEEGLELARQVSALTAAALGCETEQVLTASTGVIGVNLSLETFKAGVPAALASLSSGEGVSAAGSKGKDSHTATDVQLSSLDSAASGSDCINKGLAAAEAIMTTDTIPKLTARTFELVQEDGSTVACTIGGMAKGSGMIAPHMGTMIAVLATDVALEQEALESALKQAVDVSFNKVTIDSDTSTNDSAYLIATGVGKGETMGVTHPSYQAFVSILTEVCQELTYLIAQDGEGATKVVVVDVVGAMNDEEADKAARAIADSPLVKTAIAGHDANWGRVAMALGKSGATFRQEDVSISIMGLEVFRQGKPQPFSEEEALLRFQTRDEVFIVADLAAGSASTRIWTCDLTHGYISINGDYRT